MEKGSRHQGAPSKRNLIIGSDLLRTRLRSNIAGILGVHQVDALKKRKSCLLSQPSCLKPNTCGSNRALCQKFCSVAAPFLEQSCSTVFPAKVSSKGLFKAAAEGHSGPSLFLLPVVEIAVAMCR